MRPSIARLSKMSTTARLPIHRLPLPAKTLQGSLARLELDDQPSAQRRSKSFPSDTRGVWARVDPLWMCWPPRITRQEAEELGVDVNGDGQISLEDVLRRWDPVDVAEDDVESGTSADEERRVKMMSSERRLRLEPVLLGISPATLRDSLPHLDAGDAVQVSTGRNSDGAKEQPSSAARQALIDVISGRKILRGENYVPFSTRYCGHQFGSWAGQLGDGRAISILETESAQAGRQEIQLKGAGRTPFSRSADGLAVLRSGVREYLGCEALAALGIPSTRALALLTHFNSIPVLRENGPEPPSLLARIAPTFIRLGHFQAMNPGKEARQMRQLFLGGGWMQEEEPDPDSPLEGQGNLEGLRDLAEWCKEIMGWGGTDSAEWVRDVVRRNAETVAQWQVYGWMHGVLNSDNISIMGLTIDYGPYAFMDVYDDKHICNHSDESGLYNYRNQPSRVLFDLDKFVDAVSPLIGYEALHGPAASGWSQGKTSDDVDTWEAKAKEVMKGWEEEYYRVEKDGEQQGWRKRFGLLTTQSTDSRDVIADFLTLLHTHSLDFHASFRLLTQYKPTSADPPESEMAPFLEDIESVMPAAYPSGVSDAQEAFSPWLKAFAARIHHPAEQAAWENFVLESENGSSTGLSVEERYGPQNELDGWRDKRQEQMRRVNPRFVLRQWVLEDTIAKLESCGPEDVAEARQTLSRVLDMSSRPFYPWSTEGEEGRLCELGDKSMLGFQCSCSS